RSLSFADGVRPVVGAAELAALLQDHDEAAASASARGPGGARCETPDARRTGGSRQRATRAQARRRRSPLRLGNAPEAARLAGCPLLRPEPGKPRHVHAPGGCELALVRRS